MNIDELDDIPVVEPTSSFDATKYEGYKCKIDRVEKMEVIDYYPNGNFDKDSKQKKWIVEIETEPVKVYDEKNDTFLDKIIEYEDDSGNKKHITVTARFNLKEQINPLNGEKQVIISKHQKSKLWNFMKKKGVIKLSELKGKIVLLTAVPSTVEGDDRKFLRIVQ
jgi:hypothetical protein